MRVELKKMYLHKHYYQKILLSYRLSIIDYLKIVEINEAKIK